MEEVGGAEAKADAFWAAEFSRICKRDDFVEFYCEAEDEWLQYGDWDEKIPAVFGSVRKAVIEFRAHCSEAAAGCLPRIEPGAGSPPE